MASLRRESKIAPLQSSGPGAPSLLAPILIQGDFSATACALSRSLALRVNAGVRM